MLQTVLSRANVADTAWDVVVIGDGSGTGWKDAAGWAGVLIDKLTRSRKAFYGGMNLGSVNLAEQMPYLQALTWYDANVGRERLKQCGTLNVHIVTDSKTVATHGTEACNLHGPLPRVQQGLWAAFRELQRLGYQIHFHWAPRCESGLNYMADLIAGLSRRAVLNVDEAATEGALSERAANAVGHVQFCDPATGLPISPYEINPDEHVPDQSS